jgi:hypothetical protein
MTDNKSDWSWRVIEQMIMGISDKDPKLANDLEDALIKAKGDNIWSIHAE